VAYIAIDNPTAAKRYQERLFNLSLSLTDFPERGRTVSLWVRELTLLRPYIIQYTIAGDEVRILSVRHSARRPER
ncbi:MAG: type II toxin-antitoxin system RelE/ParE family toxin, partial [Brevundimonas sp.]|nr:type II toxin-antitoxin system RelE/ParE family toxin [Brevundimonas sp.]